MQIITDIFNTFLFGPIVNILVVIYNLLHLVNFPGALGISIILLTIIIRLIVWPFSASQMKSMKKMAELKPQLDALKNKHKDDKQVLAAAQMALYKEHGVNPAGGCLPSLIQIPVVLALYQTIFAFFDPNGLTRINHALYPFVGQLTSVPDLSFFGLNLAIKPSEFAISGLLLIPLLTAGLTFIQSKMMSAKPVKEYKSDSPKEKKEKESMEDSMSAMQGQMMYMMPIMIGYFAFQFPIGVALYWNTFTVIGIVQQYMVSGWGGLEDWTKVFKKY